MKFKPTIDIWGLPSDALKTLQPGQWVSAGAPDENRTNCGRFYGVKPSGSVVVAWNGNARNRPSIKAYHKALHTYAKGSSNGY